MSKPWSHKRVFSEQEFKKAAGISKYYMSMLQPRLILDEPEQNYLNVLKRAFVILCETPVRREAAMQIAALEGIANENSYRIMRDAEELFGKLSKVDKDMQRGIIRERFQLLAKKAEDNGDLEEARKCYEALMKLDRLDQPEDKGNKPMQLPPVLITSDPSTLSQMINDDEDTESIELDDEEALS